MIPSKLKTSLLVLHFLLINLALIHSAPERLFREYIGAEGNNVKFTDVPINPDVTFHFILAFAIDYTGEETPRPTNGDFRVYWDSGNLNPAQVFPSSQ